MHLMLSPWSRRQFSLPPFELAPLEFEPQAGEPLDELLLDEVVASDARDADAVPVMQPMPTAGELRDSIERHLRGARQSAPAVDAADELREALAELRRSIG